MAFARILLILCGVFVLGGHDCSAATVDSSPDAGASVQQSHATPSKLTLDRDATHLNVVALLAMTATAVYFALVRRPKGRRARVLASHKHKYASRVSGLSPPTFRS